MKQERSRKVERKRRRIRKDIGEDVKVTVEEIGKRSMIHLV